MVLHCFRGEIGSGVVARRMKNLKPETPIIMLFGGADQPGDALPVVDVLMRNPESPNILLAKLSEVIDRNHFSVGQTTKG